MVNNSIPCASSTGKKAMSSLRVDRLYTIVFRAYSTGRLQPSPNSTTTTRIYYPSSPIVQDQCASSVLSPCLVHHIKSLRCTPIGCNRKKDSDGCLGILANMFSTIAPVLGLRVVLALYMARDFSDVSNNKEKLLSHG
jgi:hypothetical protein